MPENFESIMHFVFWHFFQKFEKEKRKKELKCHSQPKSCLIFCLYIFFRMTLMFYWGCARLISFFWLWTTLHLLLRLPSHCIEKSKTLIQFLIPKKQNNNKYSNFPLPSPLKSNVKTCLFPLTLFVYAFWYWYANLLLKGANCGSVTRWNHTQWWKTPCRWSLAIIKRHRDFSLTFSKKITNGITPGIFTENLLSHRLTEIRVFTTPWFISTPPLLKSRTHALFFFIRMVDFRPSLAYS